MSTWRFGLVAEDREGAENARQLGDLLLMNALRSAWREEADDLGTWRWWTGVSEEIPWESFKAAGPKQPFGSGVPPLPIGSFGDGPLVARMRMWFQPHRRGVDLVVFAFDEDREPDRRVAVETFLNEAHKAAVALMNPEGQAWRIMAFRGGTLSQARAYRELCKELTFDPVREPLKLDSTTRGAQRDPKVVLPRLLCDRPDDWMIWFDGVIHDGWLGLPLESGMPQYLDRMRLLIEKLIPPSGR